MIYFHVLFLIAILLCVKALAGLFINFTVLIVQP